METKIIASVKSGIGATAVMTIMMLVAPMMGMPEMPIGKMLADFMHIPVWTGWLMHFMIGIILAAMYVFYGSERIPGSPALKGMLFSLLPFLMAQIAIMPMMGAGIFSMNTSLPMMMVAGSLIGHLVYGLVLGLLVRS